MEEKEGLGMRGHKKFGKEVFYMMKTNKTKEISWKYNRKPELWTEKFGRFRALSREFIHIIYAEIYLYNILNLLVFIRETVS